MLRSAQRGFSLTELMIGSALGLFVIAGALQLYAANVRAAADTLRVSRLNQEMRAVLQLLGDELQRAGYWAGEPGIDPHAGNPFQSATNDIRIDRFTGEAAASCLLYAYDLNGDQRVGVGPGGLPGPHESTANLEQFGVRLRAGRLQLRTGGRTFACAVGSWQALTEPDTEVTVLRFTLQQRCLNLHADGGPCTSGDPALLRRRVTIALAGRSRADPGIRLRLETEVLIANDRVTASLP